MMKRDEGFKLTLIAKTDEDAINNGFVCYVLKDLSIIVIMMLQTDWNWISYICLLIFIRDIFVIGCKAGYSDAQRSMKKQVHMKHL